MYLSFTWLQYKIKHPKTIMLIWFLCKGKLFVFYLSNGEYLRLQWLLRTSWLWLIVFRPKVWVLDRLVIVMWSCLLIFLNFSKNKIDWMKSSQFYFSTTSKWFRRRNSLGVSSRNHLVISSNSSWYCSLM